MMHNCVVMSALLFSIVMLVTSLDFNDGLDIRRKRAVSPETETLSRSVGRISFALTTDTTADCDRGLTNGGVYAILEYRLVILGNQTEENSNTSLWHHLGVVSIPASSSSRCLHEFTFNVSYVRSCVSVNMEVYVQFRLVQWEHGGGYCNCWGLVPGNLQVETDGGILPLGLE